MSEVPTPKGGKVLNRLGKILKKKSQLELYNEYDPSVRSLPFDDDSSLNVRRSAPIAVPHRNVRSSFEVDVEPVLLRMPEADIVTSPISSQGSLSEMSSSSQRKRQISGSTPIATANFAASLVRAASGGTTTDVMLSERESASQDKEGSFSHPPRGAGTVSPGDTNNRTHTHARVSATSAANGLKGGSRARAGSRTPKVIRGGGRGGSAPPASTTSPSENTSPLPTAATIQPAQSSASSPAQPLIGASTGPAIGTNGHVDKQPDGQSRADELLSSGNWKWYSKPNAQQVLRENQEAAARAKTKLALKNNSAAPRAPENGAAGVDSEKKKTHRGKDLVPRVASLAKPGTQRARPTSPSSEPRYKLIHRPTTSRPHSPPKLSARRATAEAQAVPGGDEPTGKQEDEPEAFLAVQAAHSRKATQRAFDLTRSRSSSPTRLSSRPGSPTRAASPTRSVSPSMRSVVSSLGGQVVVTGGGSISPHKVPSDVDLAMKRARGQPGPGSYSLPRSTPSGGRLSPSSSRTELQILEARGRDIPGPGRYSVRSPSPSGGRISPTSPRSYVEEAIVLAKKQPGPGQYTPKQTPISGGVISQTSGPSDIEWAIMHANLQPGPGQYYPRSPSPTGGRISPTSGASDVEVKMRSAQRLPGPGSYAISSPKPSGGRISPTSGRTLIQEAVVQGAKVPGPGQYVPRTPSPSGGRIAPTSGLSDLERAILRARSVPGPGKYETVPQLTPRGGRISPTSGKSDVDEAIRIAKSRPGPGAYRPVSPTPKGGRISPTSGAGEFDKVERRAKAIPGPGTYNTPSASVPGGRIPSTSGPGYMQLTISRALKSPGPGSYDVKPSMGLILSSGVATHRRMSPPRPMSSTASPTQRLAPSSPIPSLTLRCNPLRAPSAPRPASAPANTATPSSTKKKKSLGSPSSRLRAGLGRKNTINGDKKASSTPKSTANTSATPSIVSGVNVNPAGGAKVTSTNLNTSGKGSSPSRFAQSVKDHIRRTLGNRKGR